MMLERARKQYESDYECVVKGMDQSVIETMNDDDIKSRIQEYSIHRNERTTQFVQYIRNKRLALIDTLCPS